jgi:hypothetical protein
MTRLRLLVVLIIINCTVALSRADEVFLIDQELTRYEDVTGYGKPDRISLHLRAKNMESAFTWTLTISSDGKKIFSYSHEDAADIPFYDPSNVQNCTGNLDCKEKFYFHEILDNLVLTGNGWCDVEGILDRNHTNTLYPLGRKFLAECCGYSISEADVVLSRIEEKIRDGSAIALNVPFSPHTYQPPMVFAPEVGRFVPVYEQ